MRGFGVVLGAEVIAVTSGGKDTCSADRLADMSGLVPVPPDPRGSVSGDFKRTRGSRRPTIDAYYPPAEIAVRIGAVPRTNYDRKIIGGETHA
ncbi:MAG: hypothetical protein WA317_22045 [Mycobacterium sp.]|uniref:hypothetical protein n=1 Tax=Mycobacterium sp. TaxID=1785 RepID=UPI003CC56D26